MTQLNSITESRFEILQRIGCKNHFASGNCIQLKLLTPESKPPQIIGKFFCPLHGRPRHTGVCVLVGRILHCRVVRAAKKKNREERQRAPLGANFMGYSSYEIDGFSSHGAFRHGAKNARKVARETKNAVCA